MFSIFFKVYIFPPMQTFFTTCTLFACCSSRFRHVISLQYFEILHLIQQFYFQTTNQTLQSCNREVSCREKAAARRNTLPGCRGSLKRKTLELTETWSWTMLNKLNKIDECFKVKLDELVWKFGLGFLSHECFFCKLGEKYKFYPKSVSLMTNIR